MQEVCSRGRNEDDEVLPVQGRNRVRCGWEESEVLEGEKEGEKMTPHLPSEKGFRCYDCQKYFKRKGHLTHLYRSRWGPGLERCDPCSMVLWARWHGALEQEAVLRILE